MSKKPQYLSNKELSSFCQQIGLIIEAGLPTYYGVSILADEAPNEATQELLNKIYEPLEAGGTLHDALLKTDCFPPYLIKMVKLGEETGRLDEVLKSLSMYYEREDEIQTGIKNAITYPLVLSVLMITVIIVMIAKVLPVFSQIYAELGSELTGFSATLMTISNYINQYLVIIIGVMLIIGLAIFFLYKTKYGKLFLQSKKLSISIASSRFANCMFLSLSSGLDTDKGLELALQLIDNPYMSEKIYACQDEISHGATFSSALLRSGVFSKIYSSWIAIGSKTGSLDEVMQHICKSYENETDDRLNHFIAVLEPTLVIILCLFIGLILISFLLPLLGIMTSIG